MSRLSDVPGCNTATLRVDRCAQLAFRSPRPCSGATRRERRLSELDSALNVRTAKTRLAAIDEAAKAMGMNRSEWVLWVLDKELRVHPPERVLPVQRSRMMVGYRSPAICNHPMQVRTEKAPNGESRCMACDTTIYPLR
jgi:hypothetical protein